MVLTDDNFASIVAAVARRAAASSTTSARRWSTCWRATPASSRSCWRRPLVGLPLPLLPLQLLWINLVTDGLPALALVMDPARRGRADASAAAAARADARPRRSGRSILLDRRPRRIRRCWRVFAWALQAERAGTARAPGVLDTLVFASCSAPSRARSATRIFWSVGAFTNLRLLAVVAASLALQLALHQIDWLIAAVSASRHVVRGARAAAAARPRSPSRRWSSPSWRGRGGRGEPARRRLRPLPPRHGLWCARRRHHDDGDPRRIAGRLAERADRPHPGSREPDRRRHLDGREQLPRPALGDRTGGRLRGGGGALAARIGDGGRVHPRRIVPARRIRRRAAGRPPRSPLRGRPLRGRAGRGRRTRPLSSASPRRAARSRCWPWARSQAARPTWSGGWRRRWRGERGSPGSGLALTSTLPQAATLAGTRPSPDPLPQAGEGDGSLSAARRRDDQREAWASGGRRAP